MQSPPPTPFHQPWLNAGCVSSRHPGNRALLARGTHLPETVAVQVAKRRERAQEEQHKVERGVAGRVCQVLLPEDRSRQGEPSRLRPFDLSYILSRSRCCSPGTD